MKKLTIYSIIFILLFVLVLTAGLVLGRYVFNLKEKEVFYLDDKMEECKKGGGTYLIYQNNYDWQKKYHISCEMPEVMLFDFYIDANGKKSNF